MLLTRFLLHKDHWKAHRIVLVGVFLVLMFAFSPISRQVECTVIAVPVVFTTAGILLGVIWPAQGLPDVKPKAVTLFSKVALALVLFADATRTKGCHRIP